MFASSAAFLVSQLGKSADNPPLVLHKRDLQRWKQQGTVAQACNFPPLFYVFSYHSPVKPCFACGFKEAFTAVFWSACEIAATAAVLLLLQT